MTLSTPNLRPLGQASTSSAGYIAGYSRGMRDAEAEREQWRAETSRRRIEDEAARAAALAADRESVARAVAALHRTAAPVVGDSLDVIASAAVQLAEAVLQVALDDTELLNRSVLRRALDAAGVNDGTTIRCHPAQVQALTEAGLTAVADPSLDTGDVLAVHEHGYIDARILVALARARTALGVK